MNSVDNILAVDSTHSSRSVRRSERSTRHSTSKTGPHISSEIQKRINFLANCKGVSRFECNRLCSFNNSELNKHLEIDKLHWHKWNVTAACPFTISIQGSLLTAECQNTTHKRQSRYINCKQVYYKQSYRVGCVNALRISFGEIKESTVSRYV